MIAVVSSDLKATKMATILKEIAGFDGTQNGGTKVRMDLVLKIPWFYSMFVSEDPIRTGFGTIGLKIRPKQKDRHNARSGIPK